MKIYYPKDIHGNELCFRTAESLVMDKNGKSLTDKIADINEEISKLERRIIELEKLL